MNDVRNDVSMDTTGAAPTLSELCAGPQKGWRFVRCTMPGAMFERLAQMAEQAGRAQGRPVPIAYVVRRMLADAIERDATGGSTR